MHYGKIVTFFLHWREDAEGPWFWLTTDDNGSQFEERKTDYSWGAGMWQDLEAGADSPEGRMALATGMVKRLPCGECKREWKAALKERSPEVETAEAFARWVHDRHNDVNRRKGKPEPRWEEVASRYAVGVGSG